MSGSVSPCASKYSWFDEGRECSDGFQHTQDCCGAAQEVEPAVVGGDVLIGPKAGLEEVTKFVVAPTKMPRRSWAPEPAYRAVLPFDAAMTFLQSVIEILAVTMPHRCAQVRPDRAGITVVPIGGDPLGRDAGDHLRRCKERLRSRHAKHR